MDVNGIIDLSREALLVALKLSLPLLLTALFVGIIISLFQALTQIQDQTINFVPKLIAIFLVIFFMMPYFGSTLVQFNEKITNQIVNIN